MTRNCLIQQLENRMRRRAHKLMYLVRREVDELKSIRDEAVGDAGDLSVQFHASELTSQLAELECRELSRIEEALQRLEAGDFGICEDCGRSISMRRLHAVPYAERCVACQDAMDKERLLVA
jgi:DnaK suppressor protein